MDENLLQTENKHSTIINYNTIGFIFFATTYTVIIILIYSDIHKMSNNFDQIMDMVNITNAIDSRNDFNLIKECVLHKYCRRT